ncbi:MAG: MFS transporter [Thaumarchaeota archaeon]|nr:MFS transporter [Nitrososphaerota archaeon]
MFKLQAGLGKFIPLLAFVFVFQVSRGMTLPIFPLYFHSSNLSAINIGEVLGVYGFSFLFFEAFWGFVFEKISAYRLMPLIVLANSAAIFAFSRQASFAEISLLELVLGIGLGGVGVFPRIAIAKVAGNLERGRTFGMLAALYAVGGTVGSLLGGISDSVLGLSISFIIPAIICSLSLIPFYWHATFFGKLEREVVVLEGANSLDSSSPLRKIGNSRIQRIGLLAIGLIGLAMASNNAFFSLLFPNILGQSPKFSANVVEISVVLAIFTLSTGILSPFMSSLGWRNPRKWILGGLAIAGGLYFALSQENNILGVYFVTFFIGLSTSSITPLALSLLTARVPRNLLGRTMGVYGAVEDVGAILGSSAGSIIWGLYGSQYSFFLVGTIFLLVGTVFLLVNRKGNE